jgi:hypothetical protein
MRGSLARLTVGLGRQWNVRVRMRTGVNTGEVVVDPARPADLLVGDTLNVAARLEQAARDGEVLIGPETQRLVRGDAVLEAVEPLVLKGKAEPMPAWRLIDGTRPDGRAPRRIESPLLGRDGELRRLEASFRDAAAARAPRLVTVVGSPGLGKTRLAAEFVGSVRDEATILEGRCDATGKGITFQPVAEVIRTAADIDEDDAADQARAKIAALLPESDPERDRVVDRAAALLGIARATSTEETFWAVRRLLEQMAAPPERIARIEVLEPNEARAALERGREATVVVSPLVERALPWRLPEGRRPMVVRWRLAAGAVDRLRVELAFALALRRSAAPAAPVRATSH